MKTIVVSKQGDTVDYMAWRHYGVLGRKVVEAVLEANPGLADRGPVLPAGVPVVFPAKPAQTSVQGIRLWD